MSDYIYWIFSDAIRVSRVTPQDRLTTVECSNLLYAFAKSRGLRSTRGLTIKQVSKALDQRIPAAQLNTFEVSHGA